MPDLSQNMPITEVCHAAKLHMEFNFQVSVRAKVEDITCDKNNRNTSCHFSFIHLSNANMHNIINQMNMRRIRSWDSLSLCRKLSSSNYSNIASPQIIEGIQFLHFPLDESYVRVRKEDMFSLARVSSDFGSRTFYLIRFAKMSSRFGPQLTRNQFQKRNFPMAQFVRPSVDRSVGRLVNLS